MGASSSLSRASPGHPPRGMARLCARSSRCLRRPRPPTSSRSGSRPELQLAREIAGADDAVLHDHGVGSPKAQLPTSLGVGQEHGVRPEAGHELGTTCVRLRLDLDDGRAHRQRDPAGRLSSERSMST